MKYMHAFSFNQSIFIRDLINSRSICDAEAFILMLKLYTFPQNALTNKVHRQIMMMKGNN